MATKRAPRNLKGNPGTEQRSAETIRHALFVAACNRHMDGRMGFTKAAKITGEKYETIAKWAARYPEVIENNQPEVDKTLAQRDEVLKESYLRIALSATQGIMEKLEDPKTREKESLRDLTGCADYAVKNYRLLNDQSTGNNASSLNITEKLIIELHEIEKAERLKTLNGSQNRLKKYTDN